MAYKYQASVIVPVYNVEEYLRTCLDALVEQTIDKDKMEVLVINDGSPDNSWEICQEYAQKYSFIKIFSKENEGLSATRNFGIRHAQGKYLFFVDSDDYLTASTVKKVTDFFDKVYDEVDMVAYNELRFKGDTMLKPHFRFNELKKQGVYDLKEYPFLAQTRVNVCVKNIGEDNIFFNTTPGFKLEDQEYCNRVLMRKMKMGYCPKGIYMYNKGNASSIMSMYFHAYYLFETSMEYFENLFGNFTQNVPQYFQAMFINDISWRLKADILYPYHYEKEKFENAMRRIRALLDRVDNSVILLHPTVDIYQACYWISMKTNPDVKINHENDGIHLYIDGEDVYSQDDFVVIGHKPRIRENKFSLTGFLKSPIFNFVKTYEIYAVEGDREIKLDTFLSVHSHYNAKVVTNIFPAFKYTCDLQQNRNIRFKAKIDGVVYETHFWFMQYSGIGKYFHKMSRGDYIINNKRNVLEVYPASQKKKDLLTFCNSLQFARHPRLFKLRLDSIKYRKNHRIWLYYDFYTVEKDNGFYQFENDLKHNDGIERYYVLTHEYDDLDKVFTPEQQKHLVRMKSAQHRLLYVCAERIFTAYYGLAPTNAFDTALMQYQYEDLLDFETIYLQHGVLHASLRLQNSHERSRAEYIVVSTPFEIKNLTENYAYSREELIPTGMARYDHIDKTEKPKGRILFAPSWRKYLTNQIKASNWKVDTNKLEKSDYYKNFYDFLNNKNLHKCLEENNIFLDIKPHPIIAGTDGLFDIDSPYVNIVGGDVDVADYDAFVTDFSSYVFDFAYLERPIMYFVPDYEQFKSGMNHYRDLDLPFEEAFGPMFTDAKQAAECLCKMIKDGFVPEHIYKERLENFFFKFDGNCAENLYRFVSKLDGLKENE